MTRQPRKRAPARKAKERALADERLANVYTGQGRNLEAEIRLLLEGRSARAANVQWLRDRATWLLTERPALAHCALASLERIASHVELVRKAVRQKDATGAAIIALEIAGLALEAEEALSFRDFTKAMIPEQAREKSRKVQADRASGKAKAFAACEQEYLSKYQGGGDQKGGPWEAIVRMPNAPKDKGGHPFDAQATRKLVRKHFPR
jgi:DNA-binding protein H-NS